MKMDAETGDRGFDLGTSTVVGLTERISGNPKFRKDLMTICKKCDMDHAFYGFVNTLRLQLPGCSTYPLDWSGVYHQEGYHTHDPLISALSGSRRPTFLTDLSRIPAFEAIWVDHAGKYGIPPPQIGVPMFGPHGETAILVLHAAESPRFEAEQRQLMRKAVIHAVEFHEAVMATYDVREVLDMPVLSEREKFCLFHAAQGAQISTIAKEGGISDRTVESHLRACRAKLDAKNTVHAVAKAVHYGIILP